MLFILNKILLIFFLISYSFTFSQDIHFSQFYNSPMNVNPALTGNFAADYRIIANERTQWSSISVPYQTFALSMDASGQKKIKGFAPGIYVFNDKAGDSQLSTFQLNISAAYPFTINTKKTMFLIPAIQTGISNKKINYDKLRFDNQYNGYFYDPKISNQELFIRNAITYLNLNVGTLLKYILDSTFNFVSGISIYNITKPKQSFFDEEVRLDRRGVFFFNTEKQLNNNLIILPSAIFQIQGKFKEIILGSELKYIISKDNYNFQSVFGGLWLRTRDAAFISLGFDYHQFKITASYDFNISNLKVASNYRGGLELSIIYIYKKFIPKIVKHSYCPAFI